MAELNNSNAPEENLTEVVRVRREKLETLKEKGKNPVSYTHLDVYKRQRSNFFQ